MKNLLATVALLLSIGGCDSGAGGDVPDGGAREGDARVVTASEIPAAPFPYAGPLGQPTPPASDYTAGGVTAALGPNPCVYPRGAVGFEPGSTLVCWPPTEPAGRGGLCGVLPVSAAGYGDASVVFPSCSSYAPGTCVPVPACGTTFAPGTVRVWSMDDPRYDYLGDPAGFDHAGSSGYVCLPNVVPYVVPC
jgi:hypothetical protein